MSAMPRETAPLRTEKIRSDDPLAGSNRFLNGKHISSGTFGSVWVYQRVDDGRSVAVKFIERNAEVSPYLEAEILNHRVLRHPHIIEFKVSPQLRMAPWSSSPRGARISFPSSDLSPCLFTLHNSRCP
jgi:serine/threonine protein kinase